MVCPSSCGPCFPWCLRSLVAYLNSSATKFLPSTSSLHVAIGCFVSVLAHSYRYKNLERTRLKKDIKHFIQRLKTKNPNPTRCSRGPTRAITAGQLKEFDYYFHGYHGSQRTMYYVWSQHHPAVDSSLQALLRRVSGPTVVTLVRLSLLGGHPSVTSWIL